MRWILVGVVASASSLVACGDTADSSLCPVYEEYLTVALPVLAADPTGVTAQEAADAVEAVGDAVAQLREVSDGRYAQAVGELESVLDDLRRTLHSVNSEAGYTTWQPLVDDTIDDAVAAHERVVELIDPACVSDLDDLG